MRKRERGMEGERGNVEEEAWEGKRKEGRRDGGRWKEGRKGEEGMEGRGKGGKSVWSEIKESKLLSGYKVGHVFVD